MIEQHEAVTTTLCLLDKSNLCLSVEDIEAMKTAVTLHKPYEAATREMSADQYLTISKVIPLARSLQQLTAGATNSTLCDGLCLQMHRQFLNMGSCQLPLCLTLGWRSWLLLMEEQLISVLVVWQVKWQVRRIHVALLVTDKNWICTQGVQKTVRRSNGCRDE